MIKLKWERRGEKGTINRKGKTGKKKVKTSMRRAEGA